MCGRFVFDLPLDLLIELFGLSAPTAVTPNFNVAPTQRVAVIRPDEAGRPRLDLLSWGLIPSWAKERSIASRMINARSETAGEKPAFRRLLKSRRCLLPASGFYEWKSEGKRKAPLYFSLKDGSPLLLAGLWDSWRSPEGEVIESCTILTTDANELIDPFHDRMPVILPARCYRSWLQPGPDQLPPLPELCLPYPAELMQVWPVSPLVNSVHNNCAELVRPLQECAAPLLF
ncbi:SOS response-associated peptidase [Geomonas sp.]|uniref:SOS response-associated peptidase n=1 Tax=Geomonas sp. TaxID=2651584 RepID=UPI002B463159|nr:SOS response-associated peptidase [Geomonas sp.]HJV34286.1 SOS response-associated peptidase [Geomonas sp.]